MSCTANCIRYKVLTMVNKNKREHVEVSIYAETI